jgi:hypothetical protein
LTPTPTPTAIIELAPTTLKLKPTGRTKSVQVKATKKGGEVLGPIKVSLGQSQNLFVITDNKCETVTSLKPGHSCKVVVAAFASAAGLNGSLAVGAANADIQTATLQASMPK